MRCWGGKPGRYLRLDCKPGGISSRPYGARPISWGAITPDFVRRSGLHPGLFSLLPCREEFFRHAGKKKPIKRDHFGLKDCCPAYGRREIDCHTGNARCTLKAMPELPDIAAYIAALEARILDQPLERMRLASVFLLRTVDPPLASVEGRTVVGVRRVGKRIAIGVEGDLWLVLHLMIAGRLHWKPPQAKLAGRNALAAFDFPTGSLTLTEAGSKRRASLHLVRGEAGLYGIDPGGVEVIDTDLEGFRTALTA